MAVENEIVRGTLFTSSLGASVAQNVFTWIISDGGTFADALLLAGVETWFTNEILPVLVTILSVDATLEQFSVEIVNGAGEVVRNVGSFLINEPGTAASDLSAAAVSSYAQAYTQFPKSFGRKYFPFIAEGLVTDGRITSTPLAALLTLLAEWLLDVDIDGVGEAILRAGVIRTVQEAFESFINAGIVVDVPAYQRRRKPAVGS